MDACCKCKGFESRNTFISSCFIDGIGDKLVVKFRLWVVGKVLVADVANQ